MNSPKQVFTLRGHLSSTTCVISINDPLNETYTILSSDSKGWVIWWNLRNKRPIGTWKAHDSSILTLKQLSNGYLLTHGKDSEIKIWDIFSFKAFNVSTPMEKFNEAKYFNVDESEAEIQLRRELESTFPLPQFVSLPVNSLNFCNVELLDDHHLITPSTQSSENFDVYSIFKDSTGDTLGDQLNLKRVIANLDPYSLYKKTLKKEENIDFEINLKDEHTKRDTFGIMMKILAVGHNTFFIGYESGHIVGLSIDFNSSSIIIDRNRPSGSTHSTMSNLAALMNNTTERTVINKEPKIELKYFSSSHVPNPIISMCSHNNYLITGSSNKTVVLHDYEHSESTKYQLNNAGIQSLISLPGQLIVGFWNGIVRGFNIKSFEPIFKISKRLPVIELFTSSVGNSEENNHKQDKLKLSCLYLGISKTNTIDKSYKDIIKGKKFANKKLLYIGYNDGIIVAFEV